MITHLALMLAALQAPNEADYYAVDHLVPPQGAVLEVGGMDWMPDGRLALSTRRGQVWLVENALAKDPKDARFTLFCEGLQEGLGLKVVDGEIHVLQRGELSKLVDLDHDGRCDDVVVVANDWGVSGNYHEFTFGLPRDARGNFYASLNVGFTDPKWWHGRALAPWRGWVIQIAPDGTVKPFASGFRSPCGIGTNAAGDLFVTDNQGDWMPVCPLAHVREGRFYGAPASLAWTQQYQATKTEPSLTNPVANERTPPACWIPYKWSRSTGDMRAFPADGSFGPFDADQMVLAELTNGLVLRADLEKVRGEYQGAVMVLRKKVGSAIRCLFGADGTLLLGLTNRGWGGVPPGHGVARVRPTGRVPFEIANVRLLQDGFDITFTQPLRDHYAPMPGSVELASYHYDWWWEYGSPERDTRVLPIDSMAAAAEGNRLIVRSRGIEAGKVVRCVLNGLVSKSGEPLLHDEFAYTINQLPEGPLSTTPVARVVPPPPARESGAEGWLRLCYGDALALFDAGGWKPVEAELDPANDAQFMTKPGDAWLMADAAAGARDLTCSLPFGDAKIHLEYQLAQGAEVQVLVQGRYAIRLRTASRALDADACGAIAASASHPGRAPALAVGPEPGATQDLDFFFHAPRFDAAGKKVENARLSRILFDDQLVHDEVELLEPALGAHGAEAPLGPLVLRAVAGQALVTDLRVRPLVPARDPSGRVDLVPDDELSLWSATEGSQWTCEDEVVRSGGKRGFLVTNRDDFADVEVTLRAKISGGGLAALWLRAQPSATGVDGYCVKLNADYPDPERTGSIAGAALVKPSLVGPETWFDLAVTCRDEEKGTRITVSVNGAKVAEHVDATKRFAKGALALEHHHEGSVLEVKDVLVR